MKPVTGFVTRATLLAATMVLPLAPAHAGFFGTPKFTMSQSDDRFSTSGRKTFSSSGNRISKRSIAGGTHIDRNGVFLDPMAMVNQSTGKLELLLLNLTNITERISGMGEPNSIGRPIRVSFITGEGEPIVLPFTSPERRYGEVQCNSSAIVGCSTPLLESGLAVISIEDYRRIMGATELAIKLDGDSRSHVYETKDVAPTFLANLRTFYDARIAWAL